MSCLICQKTSPVPTCTSTLILGTIANLNTAVYIYIKDLSTDRLQREGVSSNGSGQVSLPMSNAPRFYQSGHIMEVWITLQSAVDITDAKDITISGTAYDCLLLTFYEVSNEVDGWYPFTTMTVAVED